MALFGSKKTAKKAAPGGLKDVMETIGGASGVAAKKKATPVVVDVKSAIHRPRLTEKAANLSTGNVFTFEIAAGATKHDVMRSVTALYKVKPVKVNIVNVKGKKVALRTRRGMGVKNNSRKAYVYLKKGDTIDFAA